MFRSAPLQITGPLADVQALLIDKGWTPPKSGD